MSFALDDRVKETSTTTGTGTFDLDGAVDSFQTFVAGIGDTNTTHYAIVNRDAAEWEVGLGTVIDAAPDTLARTTVLSSSNGDAAVNFSAGTKDVFCTRPASQVAGKSLKLAPEVEQSITAVTDTLSSSGSHLGITPDADYVLTSTPTIATGEDGQILLIHNAHSSFTLTLQDDSILSGSDVLLGGASGTIKPQSTMTLHYCLDLLAWSVISNPNTASAGATAELVPVRNTSGGSITAGAPVYITGYNIGQGRITIDEADGDDLAKLPAFGVLATTLGNNTNGDVITSGVAAGIINTNPGGTAVGDGVWIGTTAGTLVFDRPTTGFIQRIGTIARVHASLGVVNIFGAGRINDTPLLTAGVAGRLYGFNTNGEHDVVRGVLGTTGYETNAYYSNALLAQSNTLVVTADRLYGAPFPIFERTTFTRIGIEITSSAGTSARLGIYQLDPETPGSAVLVVDAGLVSTAGVAEVEAVISATLMPGWYILAVVFDNTPTVIANSQSDNIKRMFLGSDAVGSGTRRDTFYTAHSFAALPDPFGTLTYVSSASSVHPTLWLRKV